MQYNYNSTKTIWEYKHSQQDPAFLRFYKDYLKTVFIFFLLSSLHLTSATAQCPSGSISGKIFGDYNLNGLDDQVSEAFEGIEVQIFGSNANGESMLISSQLSDEDGFYSFSNLTDGERYRIEFLIPNAENLYAGFLGADSRSSVQFANVPDCEVNLGMANPYDYCVANPRVMVPCFVNGDPLAPGSTSGIRDAVVVFDFDAEGTEPYTPVATAAEVGSIYGVTTLTSEPTSYLSSFLKRHVGLGPLGLGGIYKVENGDGPNATVSQFLDVTSLGVNLGSIPSNTDRGLPSNALLPSNDPEAYDKLAKIGLGAIDISDDETTLWFVNLFNKSAYSLKIDSDNNPATAPDMFDLSVFPLPDAGCVNGEFRPFAIRYWRGKIFVGGVCDAEMGTADDLEAIVYVLENGTYTEVLRYDLNYEKGRALRSCEDETGWYPWTSELPNDCTGNGDYVYPSPVLSSIEVDIDGSLIMGFMDRTGNQLGFLNYGPTGDNADIKTTTGGDILRAHFDGSTYTIENNGTSGGITTAGANNAQGPGGGEFYHQDIFTNNLPENLYPHSETAQGGLAFVPGTGVVLTTALDPYGTTVNSGGVNHLSNTTGEARDPGYLLFSSGTSNSPTFGKANGLGSIALACGQAAVEIGNYVWMDLNNDGIQDPNEPPIEGVNVTLFDANGLELASVQTDVNGYYVFNDSTPGLGALDFNTQFTIVVGRGGQYNPVTGYLLDSLFLTLPNVGMGNNPDLNDSDGTIPLMGQFDGFPVAVVTTGESGQNDHSYDFGFTPAEEIILPSGKIMGRAFKDCDNDGIRDMDDFLLSNKMVRLTGTDFNNNPVDINSMTNLSGVYMFDDVQSGNYVILFETASGMAFSPQDQGNDDTIDSDVASNGATAIIMLEPGQDLNNIDAGYNDIEAPMLVGVPDDITIDCGNMPAPPMVMAIDNCTMGIQVEYEQELNGDDCSSGIIRRWKAYDDCGNVTEQIQMITTNDSEAPVIVGGPEDMNVTCGNIPEPAMLTATDNCTADVQVVFTQEVNGADCNVGIIRRWTATDDCGNSAVHTQLISTNDSEAPVFSDKPIDGSYACGYLPEPPIITAIDNCTNNVEVIFEQELSGIDCSAGIIRRWTATDDCGNSAVHVQMLMTNDTEAPILSNTPQDLTVMCGEMPEPPTVTATDNCDIEVHINYEQELNGTDCSAGIIRRWTATDDCGNSTVHVQMIMTSDTEAPVLSASPQDMTINCNEMPTTPTITATDNCKDNIQVVFEENIQNMGACNLMIERKWTATDDCGNVTVHTQHITAVDDSAPVFSNVPDNVILECSGAVDIPDVTATDNCDDEVAIAFSEMTTGMSCDQIIERTWTATDNCGNNVEHTQTIQISDNEPPVITFTNPLLEGIEDGDSVFIECNTPNAFGEADAVATDNCDANVDIVFADFEVVQGMCQVDGYIYSQTCAWKATDDCGNSTVITIYVNTTDTTPPTFNNVPDDLTIECAGDLPPVGNPTVIDNCTNHLTIDFTEEQEGDDCLITYRRIWTATDNCGNVGSAVQTISLGDMQGPQFTHVPADITLECGASIPNNNSATANDNCGQVTIDFHDEIKDGNQVCEDSYIISRIWTAEDQCGNITTAEQQIIFEDNTPPSITFNDSAFTDGMTIEVDCINASVLDEVDVIVSDNCAAEVEVDLSTDNQAGTCETTGYFKKYDYIWTATDNCGNQSTISITILLTDLLAPTFTNTPEDITVECSAIPSPEGVSAIDNCGGDVEVAFEETQEATGCASGYTIIRTWTAYDACDNSVQTSQRITVEDTYAPTFSNVPNQITLTCGEAIPEPTELGFSVEDNCDDDIDITFQTSNLDGSLCTAGVGFLEYIITATDDCGNATEVKTTLIYQADTTPPTIMGVPSDLVITCNDPIPTVDDFEVTAIDNCDPEVEVVLDIQYTGENNCISGGADIVKYIWTATDDCGNATEVTTTITFQADTTPPTIMGPPSNLFITCNDPIPNVDDFEVSATDNCDQEVEVILDVQYFGEDNCISGSSDIVKYIYTATDDCGNVAETSFSIFFERDVTPPVLSNIPMDMTISCDEETDDMGPTATDDCDDDVLITFETEMMSGDCTSGAEIIRTWIATDNCGNTATTTQLITITDTEAPVFGVSYLEDITAECDAIPQLEPLIAMDNCNDDITALPEEIAFASGPCEGTGISTIAWTATDACGNSATLTQKIILQDTTAPTFDNKPVDITIACDVNPVMPIVTASDNCSSYVDVSLEEIKEAQTCPHSYVIQRIWTASDACGNTATHVQKVTVQDLVAPILNGVPQDIALDCGAPIPDATTVTASDNCSAIENITINFDETSTQGNCPSNYTITRTWRAIDECGNETVATQQINVVDSGTPTFDDAPQNITVECDAIPDAPALTASDVCSGATTVQVSLQENIQNGDCADNYSIVRIWTAMDACGNAITHEQIVTVVDTTNPTFDNVPMGYILVNIPNGESIPPVADVAASDNCDNEVEIIFEETSSFDGCEETIIRTWEAVDNCGNSVLFTQTIVVSRNINLEAVVVDDTCYKEEGSVSLIVSGATPPYTYTWSNGATTNSIIELLPGDYTVTVTDADGCQNILTATVGAPSPEECMLCGTTIGDYVWLDSDLDGIQDFDEPGVSNVVVSLVQAGEDGEYNTEDDVIIAADITDNTGHYEFNCVPPGTYAIQFYPLSLPDNAIFTEQDAGDNDELDSDAMTDTGFTAPFTIEEGLEEDLSFDAGIIYDCLNVVSGGEICCDQVLCGPGSVAETLYSVTPASGGFGPVEYLWMMATHDIDFDFNSTFWTPIPGATGESYDPGALYQTTYFVRCARSFNCDDYTGETDVIVIEVLPSCINGETFQFVAVESEALDNGDALVTWEVINEVPTGVYVVQYSVDGEEFDPIEIVHLNTDGSSNYSFVHTDARLGFNYYRIKYVDTNTNLITFSPAVKVNVNDNEEEVHIYPNPFEHKVYLEILNPREDIAHVEIVDAYGKILQQFDLEVKAGDRIELDFTNKAQSVYFVKVKFGYYQPTTYKLIKAFE